MAKVVEEVEVGGHTVRFSNPDKVLYPACGFTKRDVLDYYLGIAPVLLDHLRGRALTMRRWPDGVEAMTFYEKRCPKYAPDWIDTVSRDSGKTGTLTQCAIDDPAGLAWVASLASIELHVPMARGDRPGNPTGLVFDFDPGPGADAHECCMVALDVRALLGGLELQAFPKTSGKKGVQLYVPLDPAQTTFDDTKAFAKAVAQLLERAHPDLVVSSQKKELRTGRVLIDWSQNDISKTTVCAYSLRARPTPGVSTPLTWTEVERGARRRPSAVKLLELTPKEVLRRVDKHGDLFAPLAEGSNQRLPTLGPQPD